MLIFIIYFSQRRILRRGTAGTSSVPSSAETKYHILLEEIVYKHLVKLCCNIIIIEKDEGQINNEVYRMTFQNVDFMYPIILPSRSLAIEPLSFAVKEFK